MYIYICIDAYILGTIHWGWVIQMVDETYLSVEFRNKYGEYVGQQT